jgi:drug/metabolite transporter (DMT)-like permease
MLGIALGVSASVCWGLGDFLGGITTRRVPGIVVVGVSQIIGLLVLGLVVAVGRPGFPGLDALLPGIAAGVVSAGGIVCLYKALAIGTMSIVAPIAATSAIVPVLVGAAQGEDPSAWQIAGMVLAGIGVVLASRSGESDQERAGELRKSVLLAIVSASSLGFVLVGVHIAAEKGALWAVLSTRTASVTLLLVVLLVSRAQPRTVMRGKGAIALIGLLDVSASCFYAVASTHSLLSVAGVAASLYPVVTVVMARALLKERVRGVQRAGMFSALVGVVLLAAG